jgi:predicted Zn finger-like uncharacterized protein
MATCQLCKREFSSVRFDTADISVCLRCVNSLNGSPQPAAAAIGRLGELLARGMQRNIERDLQSEDSFLKERAKRLQTNFQEEHASALPGWINKLLKDSANSTRDFKIVRAYRRGLLRLEAGGQWDYPSDWAERASRIRRRDRVCQLCKTGDVPLDVHHIVYLSNFGTNQQGNLVALCRPCHEKEHDRSFDLGEVDAREYPQFNGDSHAQRTSVPNSTAPSLPSVVVSKDLVCPGCQARITARIPASELDAQKVRCPSCKLVFVAADHPAIESTRQAKKPLVVSASSHSPQLDRSSAIPASPRSTLPKSAGNPTGFPEPEKAWMVGPLRLVRLGVALVIVFLLLSFLGTLWNLINRQNVSEWPIENATQLVLLHALFCALMLTIFDWLRKYINRKHLVGYGYPHPSLKKPWSL